LWLSFAGFSENMTRRGEELSLVAPVLGVVLDHDLRASLQILGRQPVLPDTRGPEDVVVNRDHPIEPIPGP
jgi:hypothetical protein